MASIASGPRGRTDRGRERARARVALLKSHGRPLLRGEDHGSPVVIHPEHVGAGRRNERWVEPFLDANRAALTRLDLRPEVAYEGELVVRMHPGERIGAVPLVSPATRKVAAGLLIQPRFRWSHLGDVIGRIGFGVEPRIGGGFLVPGAAREVPPWLLAGPVLRRLDALLQRRVRSFVERHETRSAPRGRVRWNEYAARSIASGRWHHLPCTFTEPHDDPLLMANIRWTLRRVMESIGELAPTPIGRRLIELAQTLQLAVGAGPHTRPSDKTVHGFDARWLAEAVEAMGWVSEERGLGGARTLDGLAWDLSVDDVWEQWVAHVVAELGRSLGLSYVASTEGRHVLHWKGDVRSMGALVPDVGLRGNDRVIWIDAKYKPHLLLLARKSWTGLSAEVKEAHRADIHQALAYAAIADTRTVDTVLAYPLSAEETERAPAAVATVVSGAHRVRLLLAGLPFGFRSPSHRDRVLAGWRELLSLPSR